GSFVGAATPAVDPSIPAGKIPIFTATTTEGTYRNDYTNVLPSLNLRVKFTDTLQARFAAAKAIARPDYSQLQAYTTLSVGITGSGSNAVADLTGNGSGNPYLKPTQSNQYDATLEWYFAPTGSLTAAVFYKDLKDVVTNALYNVPYAATNGTVYQFATTAPVNGAKGTAKGFEIAYSQFFDFLPGWASGFGVFANYTLTDAEIKTAASYAGRNTFVLPGQSDTIYNAALFYEKYGFSARVSYTHRSDFLEAIDATRPGL
ncbi:MAG: TonB-dependent receptor domain-containing protein, partial [Roseateles sp.]